MTTCLFLKPHVSTAEGREKQTQVIRDYIPPAIEQAGLTFIGLSDGVEVDDITYELIEQVHQADIIVIDVNHYETDGVFTQSPYLFYLMALAHRCGNRTILVCEHNSMVPASLLRHHTLTYGNGIWKFIASFKRVALEITTTSNSRPDNPVQEYLRETGSAAAARSGTSKEGEKPGGKEPDADAPITFRRVPPKK